MKPALIMIGILGLIVLALAGQPDGRKSIAANCQERFSADPEMETRCELVGYGKQALVQADRRDAEREAAIEDVLRQSR